MKVNPFFIATAVSVNQFFMLSLRGYLKDYSEDE